MALRKRTESADENVEIQELVKIAGGMQNGAAVLENSVEVPQKGK